MASITAGIVRLAMLAGLALLPLAGGGCQSAQRAASGTLSLVRGVVSTTREVVEIGGKVVQVPLDAAAVAAPVVGKVVEGQANLSCAVVREAGALAGKGVDALASAAAAERQRQAMAEAAGKPVPSRQQKLAAARR